MKLKIFLLSAVSILAIGTFYSQSKVTNSFERGSLKVEQSTQNISILAPITQSKEYRTNRSISASSQISPDAEVNLKGKQILLIPGFKAEGNFSTQFIALPESSDLILNTDILTVSPEIQVSPNPSSGLFKILLKGITEEGMVEVFTLSGNLVVSKNFKGESEISINIQNQPSGIYIVKLKSTSQTITQKVIKN